MKHIAIHIATLLLPAAMALGCAACSDEWQKAIDDGTIPDMTGEQLACTTNVSSSGSDSRGYSPSENGTAGYTSIN